MKGELVPNATPSPRNDCCIKMGSDESHFNTAFKVTSQCPQTSTFEVKRRAEADSSRGPSAYQPNALPLGQTGCTVGKLVASVLLASTETIRLIRDGHSTFTQLLSSASMK